MARWTAVLSATVLSLPMMANAQRAPRSAVARGTVTTPSANRALGTQVCPAPLRAPIALARPGLHPTLAAGLREGLSVVDLERVDVDGDGDRDLLALVDEPVDRDDPDASLDLEPKPDLGRGVVVAFHEANGWRIETIASTPREPLEAGYNWGPVERRRDGDRGGLPLLHVHFSAARAGRFERVDTPVRFDPQTRRLRVECSPVRTPVEHRARTAQGNFDSVHSLVARRALARNER